MKLVEPKVFLIGETRMVEDGESLAEYLEHIGVPEWTSDGPTDLEQLLEVDGRVCYRSFKPGLNPNVTKVREHNDEYLGNVIAVKHGSVLEHGVVNFIFADVSRVFTHELVRHRAGTAISQESLRFVRLTDISMWIPSVLQEPPKGRTKKEHEAFLARARESVVSQEVFQKYAAEYYGLDNDGVPFHFKKVVTSALRRFAPDGLATTVAWSANIRAIRHVIEMRTEPSAEEEIRLVFGKVGDIVAKRYPNLFADYTVEMVEGLPHWKTDSSKV